MTDLMCIGLKPKESVQQYGDIFSNLMRRTVRGDSDETLIPMFIKGLDNELQEMMNISKVTEITASLDGFSRAPPSVKREIKRAMTLDAGRSRKTNNSRSEQPVAPRPKKEPEPEPPKMPAVPKVPPTQGQPSPTPDDPNKKNKVRKCFNLGGSPGTCVKPRRIWGIWR